MSLPDAVLKARLRKLTASGDPMPWLCGVPFLLQRMEELDAQIKDELAAGGFNEYRSDDVDLRRRRYGRHQSLDKPLAPDDPESGTPHDVIADRGSIEVETEQTLEVLSRILIPEEQRVVELRGEEWTIDDIAKEVGMPRSTVSDLLKRVRGKIEAPDLIEHQVPSHKFVRSRQKPGPKLVKIPARRRDIPASIIEEPPPSWRDMYYAGWSPPEDYKPKPLLMPDDDGTLRDVLAVVEARKAAIATGRSI